MFRFDRKRFFDGYRGRWGALSQSQVDGLEFLLGKIEKDSRWVSVDEIAYALATIKHETGDTYEPITEKRASKTRQPDLWADQNRYWKTNHQGRGYIQLTWSDNYEKYGIKDTPERALEPDLAYEILTDGMHRGVYTGKKLSDYINSQQTDYFNARRIVNRLDKAELIAGYAKDFDELLTKAQIEDTPAVSQITVEHADEVTTTPVVPVEGGGAGDPQQQASQGGRKSFWSVIAGGGASAATAIGGWFQGSAALKVVGIVCLTVLILALIFRQLIMDWVRMKYLADPSKINVR